MTNSLRKLAKDLKAFAKRCKDFKYTEQALFVFLLCGIVGFADVTTAPTDKAIQNQRQEITTSIGDMRQQFKRVKSENDKLMKNYNLELIQLMEQGDHVVKSPWSSWQYGINTFYNDWHGTYKGKGDKVGDEKYTRDSSLNKYKYSRKNSLKYGGTTELSLVKEPNAEIPVSASLTPLVPQLKSANLALNVDLSGLPSFEPTTVMPPVTPQINAPNPNISIDLDITSGSRGSGETVAIFPASGDGALQDVAVNSGTIKTTIDGNGYDSREVKYTAGNVMISQIYTGAPSSQLGLTSYYGTPININTTKTTTGSDALFHVSGYHFGVTLNGADVEYNSINANDPDRYAELVHQDVHGGSNKAIVSQAITDGGVSKITTTDFDEISKINVFETNKTVSDNYNLFANSGNVKISGDRAIFSSSYNHGGHTNGIIWNAGNITIDPITSGVETKHTVFLVSNDTSQNDSQQHFYNTGNILTNTSNTAIAVFSPNKKRNISVTNKGTMKTVGDNSVGVYANNGTKGVNLHLNFSDATNTGNQKQLSNTDYRSDDIIASPNDNKYVNELSGGITNKTTARGNSKPLILAGKNNAGIYMPKQNSYINGQFAVDVQTAAGSTEGSAGIYSASNIDLQGHYIKIGGNDNVGVYPILGANIYLGKGSVELNGGHDNTGIVVKTGQGNVYSESEMLMESGKNNTAIYAQGASSNVVVKSIETDTTEQEDSVFVYAESNAKVKVGSTKTVSGTTTTTGGLVIKGKISNGSPVYDATTGKLDKNVGGVYAKGGSTVDISNPSLTTSDNISIQGARAVDTAGSQTDVYAGFGLFAKGSTIKADGNKVYAKDTGVAVASIGSGGKVTLDKGEVSYDGSGYALYSDGTGEIDLTSGKLTLDGNATGYIVNATGTNPIHLTGTNIFVKSDKVILMDLRNVASMNTSTLGTTFSSYLGGANIDPSSNAYKYKYAVVDGTTMNIDSDINKADTTSTSNDYIFTRRLLLQNSKINVNSGKTVTANLGSTDLTSMDLTVPVGLAVAASSKSTDNNSTAITNDGTVTVNRTDSGNGGVGLYVNYGHINNNASGVVDVETTGNNPNAVGIYGTNSTPIVNDGTVTVGGDKSFGILGLSYRLDKTGAMVDPSTEAYYKATKSSSGEYGKVDITNNSTITMNKDSALGIYAHNNSLAAKNTTDRRTSNTEVKATNTGTITMNGGNNSIGMGTNRGTLVNTGTINVNGTVSAGMYGTDKSSLTNTGTINVAASSAKNESIGMYTDDKDTTITTSGTINVGDNSYGIYGKTVNMTGGAITVGDNAVGVYSKGPNVNLNGTITVGNNNAVGAYIEDETPAATTTVTGNTNMTIGDNNSFGYIITSKGAPVNLTTGSGTTATVGEKSVYIYSAAPASLGGTLINNTAISTTRNNGYGIYSSQNSENYGAIDLTANNGVGNIGIYSTEGLARNYATINVGETDLTNEKYGIGMATGYYNKANGAISNQGTIENNGVINVTKDNSIGMYAVGSGSTAINRGTINLDGNKTTGMYIDRNATGINYGTIQTVPGATGSEIKGVVTVNGGILKNYGTIEILGSDNMGVYRDNKSSYQDLGSGSNTSTVDEVIGTPTTSKSMGSVEIKVPNAVSVTTVTLNGVNTPITTVDTNKATPDATDVIVTDPTGSTTLNFGTLGLSTASNTSEASSLGMYIDTSGINHTHPIQGLNNLIGLKKIDLIMGTEATEYTGAKAIEIGDNILDPFNTALSTVVTTGGKVTVNAGSLTWLAQPYQTGTSSKILDKVYLVKVPYTDFASKNDVDTQHFLDGLEQRYGVEGIGTREKQVFNKLNSIGKGETHIFTQAVNEMKGYQYSNTQHRINETGSLLDKEFRYLHDEWRNPSKQNNKIKVFGMRNEYNTDTAGVIDYNSKAYGVAYVHEDETVKLGNSSGWYAGAINNRFEFKDLGKSRENQTMVKAGIFKTMSPYNDHNGSLRWTIAGDVFAGQNEMKRRYWIVDDTFSAKGDYTSYGAALKTDLGYDIRMSERTHLRPYGALKMEYGRFNDIKEDSGEVRLEVNGNDYFSVKPEVGVEFKYVQPMAVRTQLSVGLSAAYENELGKVNKLNQARVRYTTADWYNLRNEKEDRRGNGKFDFNLGVDNTRFGVTVNAGYDTKGSNIRGGIGFRAIY